jgi:TetR/AcrR family transcriptional regulator
MARLRAKDYDDKRTAILEQAATLFATEGFAAASLSRLAAACETSKASLYHYYQSKEAILFDILDAHIRLLLEIVEAAAQAPAADARSRLKAMVRALIGAYDQADHEHRVLLNEIGRLAPDQQDQIRRMERTIVARFAAAIAAALPEMAGHERWRTPATMSLLGMLNWHYTWFRRNGWLSREAYADFACALFLDGVPKALSETAEAPAEV